jgi:hypothetical protein
LDARAAKQRADESSATLNVPERFSVYAGLVLCL